VRLSRGVRWNGMLLSVHNVVETLYIGDERKPHGPMLATNVFQRGASGWRLLSHHSSTAADREAWPNSGNATKAARKRRGPCIESPTVRRLAARRPRPDPLPPADPTRSPALPPATLGDAGRRLHRPRLEPCAIVRMADDRPAAGAFSRSRRQFEQSLRTHPDALPCGSIGWAGVVVNFRGCSGESNRLPRAYHSGDSDEIDWILRRLQAAFSGHPRYAVGVSLGGNALLKWLGEREYARRHACLQAAAAISAPLDLAACGHHLAQRFQPPLHQALPAHPEAHAATSCAAIPACSTNGGCARPTTFMNSTMSSRHRCMALPAPTTTGDERRANPGCRHPAADAAAQCPERPFPAATGAAHASQVAASVQHRVPAPGWPCRFRHRQSCRGDSTGCHSAFLHYFQHEV
jgi:hypothetical protein